MVSSPDGCYSLLPFSLLHLPHLEVEPLLSKNMFCYLSYAQGQFDPNVVEDHSFLWLLHLIHKHLCELNSLTSADAATRWLDSITFFPTRVSAALTDHSPGDLSHLLTRIKREDYCVVKMDIEGEEWNVIPRLELTGAIRLIDELMVEFHFNHPMMYPNLWTRDRLLHSLEQKEAFMRQLRSRDSLVFHYWP